MIEGLLMHPLSRSVYRCRVQVTRDGLLMSRVSGEPEPDADMDATPVESKPIAIVWRSLRGFSADESHVSPDGRRLQVLEIDTDDGVLTVFAPAADVAELFSAVGRRAGLWRLARSPLGLVISGRRKKLAREVA
jgi:hypothetical protein